MTVHKKSRSRYALPRRTVLRGILGGATVALALPPLEAMLNENGDALADGTGLPVRFMTWFWGNGKKNAYWNPDLTGPNYDLKAELAPLANVQDYCTVLTNFSNKAGYGRRGHHDGVAGFFSGHPFIELPANGAPYASKFGGPSIDQVAADLIAAASPTYLPSLQLAVSKRVTKGEGPTLQYLSHRGPDQPLTPFFEPIEVFDELFGNFTPPDDKTGPLRVKMLDAVREDTNALMKRVSAADRIRLESHLDSIAQLRGQILAEPPACTKPNAPTQTNEDFEGKEPLEEVSLAMADLVRIAFQCDLTRVISFQQSGSVGGTVYHMTGATTEMHGLSHDEPGDQELVHQAILFNMQCFAYLLEQLMATEEGAGNLLDNSVILCGSDCQEGVNHSSQDQPAIVAGGGGGRLVHPGIHYRSGGNENTSDILLACLQAVDPTVTEVGSAEGYSNNPLGSLQG